MPCASAKSRIAFSEASMPLTQNFQQQNLILRFDETIPDRIFNKNESVKVLYSRDRSINA